MRKKITKLIRQNSKHQIVKEFNFNNRNYEIDDLGNFYRNGNLILIKPDRVNSLSCFFIDDKNERIRFKLHQVVWQVFNNCQLKEGHSVDHINRNRLDNRLTNLRLCSQKEQFMNRENSIYKYKKVKCLNNGIIYNSCKEAENKLNLVKNTVSRVARGERRDIKGYRFQY